MIEIATLVASGAVLGFLIGMTGVGGGVLTVPVLILIMRLDPISAVGTASLYSVLTKIYAAFRHHRQKTVSVRVGLRFLVPALPGVICSSLLVMWGTASLSPAGVDTLQSAISYVIILSIVFSLVVLLFDSRFEGTPSSPGLGRTLSAFSVFLVGAIIGATSIGGGILIIPALLLFYRDSSNFVGTSIFVVSLLMLVMSVIYGVLGQHGDSGAVNLRVAGFMALGSLVGTHYGSGLSKRIEPRRLRFVVVGVIILAAAMMFADRLGIFRDA